MNPPFVSWEQMTIEARNSVRELLGLIFKKRPNQASAFLFNAINSLKVDGVIGCVLPSSVFTLDSYIRLRDFIKDTISISIIGKLGNFIFENALTDVSFLVGKKESVKNQVPLILWASNEKGIASNAIRDLRKFTYSRVPVINKHDYSIYHPVKFPINSENWKTLSYSENSLFKKVNSLVLSSNLARVQDIFTIKQGIRTGNNQVFILSKSYYENLIPEAEKKYFRPSIDNDSIKNGTLLIQNYIWYPYNKDGMIFSNQEELAKKASDFYKSKLLPNKESLENRSGISEWWGLTRPRNWQFEQTFKLCSTEFGKLGSFAYDKNGLFVIERGNGWIPKKEFKEDDYYFYLTLFSSPLFETLLSIYSKQLAGGKWWALGNKHTKLIPIPMVTDSLRELKIYSKLIFIGKEIIQGRFSDFRIIDDYLKNSFYQYE